MAACPYCRKPVSAGVERCPACGAWLTGLELAGASGAQLDADLERQLRDEVQRGDKIGAIKRYREATGVGLKEAKEAVEALEAGGSLPLPPGRDQPVPLDEVIALALAGKKIEAIKVYRGLTGAGLADAKDAVEELARRHS